MINIKEFDDIYYSENYIEYFTRVIIYLIKKHKNKQRDTTIIIPSKLPDAYSKFEWKNSFPINEKDYPFIFNEILKTIKKKQYNLITFSKETIFKMYQCFCIRFNNSSYNNFHCDSCENVTFCINCINCKNCTFCMNCTNSSNLINCFECNKCNEMIRCLFVESCDTLIGKNKQKSFCKETKMSRFYTRMLH